jgi:hypothetical protein
LPKHQPYDYTIDLEKGEQPSLWPIYNLSQNEIVTFWKYMDENLDKGFTQHSKSPNDVSILFVKKERQFLMNVYWLL